MESDRGHSTALRGGDHLGTWRHTGSALRHLGHSPEKHGDTEWGEAHGDMERP